MNFFQKSNQKIKKWSKTGQEAIRLKQNPDILKTISNAGNNRPDLVIGFAAETEDILSNGIRKLKEKSCDWILANDVGAGTQTFGGDSNAIQFISKDEPEAWPVMKKREVAHNLVKKIIFQRLHNKVRSCARHGISILPLNSLTLKG